jgi:outer membrane protein
LQSLQQDGQFLAKKLKASQQEVAQGLGEELGSKYQAALKQLVESEKIGLLLNAQAALYASGEYDITPKVTELMNKAK